MHPSPSEHTRLINVVIALHTSGNKWPAPLSDLGYELLAVEETFNVGTTGSNPCNPDVISYSYAQSIILLVECKGGKNLGQEQLETFLLVEPNDVSKFATVSNPSQLTVKKVYAVSNFKDIRKHFSSVLNDIAKKKSVLNVPKNLDILELTLSLIRIHSTDKAWEAELLTGIVVAETTYPNWFYPFSKDDNAEWKLSHVVRSLLHIMLNTPPINLNQITVRPDQIVLDLFQAYPYINPRHRNVIKGEVTKCFDKLLKEPKVKGLIVRMGTQGRPLSIRNISQTVEALRRLAQEIEKGESQTSLEEFFPP